MPVEKSAPPPSCWIRQADSEEELRKPLRAKNGEAELAMTSARFSFTLFEKALYIAAMIREFTPFSAFSAEFPAAIPETPLAE